MTARFRRCWWWRVALVVIALVVGACSTPATPAPGSGATPTASAAATPGTPVTLRFLICAGCQETALEKLIKRFNAKDALIQVKLETVPFVEFYRTIQVQLASGDPADIMWPDPSFMQGYIFNGAALPICCGTGDDVFTADQVKDFESSLLNSVSSKGVVYQALANDSGIALFYNKDLFDKAGIQPPSTAETAWTWSEAIAAMQKVKQESGGQVTVWGSTFPSNPPNQYYGMLFPRSMGAKGSPTHKAISDDGCKVTGYMDTPEAIQGFQLFQDLFVKYRLVPTQSIPECFQTGKCATMISSNIEVSLNTQYPQLRWGVTPFPYAKTPIVHSGSLSYMIAARTKHPKEAKAFLRFAMQDEQSVAYLQDTGLAPARRSLAGKYPASQALAAKLIIDNLAKWGQSRPATPGFSEYNTITAAMFADLMNGASVADRVKQGAKDVDAQLVKYCR